MANPFDYISLDNGTKVMKLQTNRDSVADKEDHFWITDYDGILDPGESTGSSVGKDFADGATFDPDVTISGKNITIDITIAHPDREVRRALFDKWIDFLKPKNFILDTDWKGPYTAQYVSYISDEGGKGTEDNFSGTLTLITKESW